MEQIVHRNFAVNGINMHVAEIGEGPAVLFLHGFPELWYSWRHQMLYLSSRGYRAIATDLRGYGDTDVPSSVTDYTIHHIVGDLVALLDALSLEKVFLVGHDWGAIIAWSFCLFRPDRIKALVNTSVAFQPRNPSIPPIQLFKAVLGDGFYMCRFQEHPRKQRRPGDPVGSRFWRSTDWRRLWEIRICRPTTNSGSDENPRRARHATDREAMAAPRDAGAPRRRRGRRAPTNFEREMRTMAASVRQLAQHQAQMQGYIQTMHMQRNRPQGEDSEEP
ncbi:alpha/beta-Hydrolases superfamily protein [Abeliophyllum distichum]|uniref:Alpha/beta-Hydrolases superfamily protein n=1 Tax=Abeliophyllum distichum TaxID=126358 RepID=A0ABD1U2Y8_9LAMI